MEMEEIIISPCKRLPITRECENISLNVILHRNISK